MSVTEEFDNVIGALAGNLNRSMTDTLDQVSESVDAITQPFTDVATNLNEEFSKLVEKYPEEWWNTFQTKIKEQLDGSQSPTPFTDEEIEIYLGFELDTYAKVYLSEGYKRGYYLAEEQKRLESMKKQLREELQSGFSRTTGLLSRSKFAQAVKNNQDLYTMVHTMSNTDEKSLPVFKLFRKFKQLTEKAPAAIEQATKKSLRKLLKSKPSKFVRNSMTRLALFGDLQALLRNNSIEKIKALVNNREERIQRIDALKDSIRAKVENSSVTKGILAQAEGLAEHMQDQSNMESNQLRNAKAIVMLDPYEGALGNRYDSIKGKEKELIELVDELVTLQSMDVLQKTNPDAFYAARRLMNEETEFFTEVLQVNRANVTKAKAKLFSKKGEDYLMLKGHTVEKYRHQIVSELAPKSEELYWAEKGYEMIPMEGYDNVAMFIKRGAFGSSHMMGIGTAMSLKAKGQAVTDVLAVNDPSYKSGAKAAQAVKNVAKSEARLAYEEQILGKPRQARPKLVPVMSPSGKVVSYNHVAGGNFRDNFLQRELDVVELTAAGRGTIERKIGHKTVLRGPEGLIKALDKDFRANFFKERNAFVRINGNDFLEDGRPNVYKDLFYQLDPELQKNIADWGGGVPIRKADLHSIIGSKKYSIAESTPIAHLQEMYPNIPVEYYTRVAEQLIKEFATITKLDIVVRTPEVFLGNLVSNMVTLSLVGMNPYQATKLMIEGFKHTARYEKLFAEKAVLENKQNAYPKKSAAYNKYGKQIAQINAELKQLPIYPLVQQGLYTVINTDVDSTEVEGLIDTKINDFKEKHQGNVIFDAATTVTDWAYLTKNTPVFQFMSQGTNMMDFAARYAMYAHLKNVTNPKSKQYNNKTHKRLDTEDKITEVLLNAFVYYDLPDGPMLEYANAMGFVMFTKYWMRMQKFLGYLVKNHATELGKLAALQATVGQVDNVMGQFVLTKDLGYMFSNPADNFVSAVTPMGIKNFASILGF